MTELEMDLIVAYCRKFKYGQGWIKYHGFRRKIWRSHRTMSIAG